MTSGTFQVPGALSQIPEILKFLKYPCKYSQTNFLSLVSFLDLIHDAINFLIIFADYK